MKNQIFAGSALILIGLVLMIINMGSQNYFVKAEVKQECPRYQLQMHDTHLKSNNACPYTSSAKIRISTSAIKSGCPAMINAAIEAGCPGVINKANESGCPFSKQRETIADEIDNEGSACTNDAVALNQ